MQVHKIKKDDFIYHCFFQLFFFFFFFRISHFQDKNKSIKKICTTFKAGNLRLTFIWTGKQNFHCFQLKKWMISKPNEKQNAFQPFH